jgi:hypothetical protein
VEADERCGIPVEETRLVRECVCVHEMKTTKEEGEGENVSREKEQKRRESPDDTKDVNQEHDQTSRYMRCSS